MVGSDETLSRRIFYMAYLSVDILRCNFFLVVQQEGFVRSAGSSQMV